MLSGPAVRLVEQTEAHVLVGLLGGLLLLLLLGRGGGIATGGGTARGGGSGRAAAGADVRQQVLDVLALEGLGEQRRPDGLDVGDLGGLDQGLELVGLYRKRERRGKLSVSLVIQRVSCLVSSCLFFSFLSFFPQSPFPLPVSKNLPHNSFQNPDHLLCKGG